MTEQPKALKLTVLLVSSLTIMSMVTISPALPQMSEAFKDIPNAEFLVKMVLTLPALFIATISPIAGQLIDRYGRLKLLYVSMVLYAVAGVSGFFLDDLYVLLATRALLGVAVGVSMTVVNTLVADYFEGPARQKFVGIQVAFMSLGGILFIGLGGVLADINWRYPFLLYLFSLVVLPLALKYLYEPERAPRPVPGEVRKKSPGIIWLLFVNVMVMWILFFMIPVQVPFQMVEIGIDSNSMVGAAIALSTLFSAVSSFSYSRMKDKFSFYSIFAAGYLLMAAAFVIVAMAESYLMVTLAMMLAGLGMGMMIPNTNIWVMRIAPVEIRGREIGRLTTFWFLGQFLSPILLLPVSRSYSISNTFYFAAIALLVISVFFLLMQISSSRKPAVQ
ncbi:MFS transporter [Fulvivirga sedimenti]|uniref:MFS transporter n=1 Tax=Fulvivirga sedimenti TaxID=2879465 RepID=A0A9X1HPA6_9BACT|nr:MFS transporter [Fulvivirga sedimenti]MCA6074498.1 MFS transporter [Fulvivirga sedimenti]MCA6075675.1 MFS transporter [Fulvivirga sedimenti]MCA6076803.1 MFS transporter [Fulvivirga sedimenti]